jgi:4-hydroxy-3-methylbut-2-en-1-yl diphosphate reductase
MKILPAEEMGMCRGVKRALRITRRACCPKRTAVYGELVHNEEILKKLDEEGFTTAAPGDMEFLAHFDTMVITAHGISPRERARLIAAGKHIIDATCPIVKKLQDTALEYEKNGYFIVITGKKGHAEVGGVTGGLNSFAVVEEPSDVRHYNRKKIAVLSQTTMLREKTTELAEKVREMNPKSEVTAADTLCRSTERRQEALRALLGRIDILIVVGGKASNNTRQLCGLAEAEGIEYRLVQSAEDVNFRWFLAKKSVGVTAGASTPDGSVQGVIDKIKGISDYQTALNRVLELRLKCCEGNANRRNYES